MDAVTTESAIIPGCRYIDLAVPLRYCTFGVIERISPRNLVPVPMEEREILEAIEVIFSKDSREDSLQYRYADTKIITSLGKPPETLICHEPD